MKRFYDIIPPKTRFFDIVPPRQIETAQLSFAKPRFSLGRIIKGAVVKITCVWLIIGLNWTGLSAIIETRAYFNDTENSEMNTLSGTTLDFSLIASDLEKENGSEIEPGDSFSQTITIINNGSLDFQYIANSVKIAGDDALCQGLELETKLEGSTQYQGPLLGFITLPLIFSSSTDDWQFNISLPETAPQELQRKFCQFKFGFYGSQIDSLISGFNDSEEKENVLESGYWTEEPSEIEISPIADAYVNQSADDTNFGSSNNLKIRSKKHANYRSFIKFDFHFPSGTTILSSFLKLFMYLPPNAARQYEASKVKKDWEETDPEGIAWDYQPEVSESPTTLVDSGTTPDWLSFEVTSDVQGFVEGAEQNYGWRLKDSQENSSKSYLAKFRSRESSHLKQRPILEIGFISPEATTTHPAINEIYYYVGSDKGADPKNEWVEIYNPTEAAVDISGWRLCDKWADYSWGCDIIPTSNPIPAKGFAVVASATSTWDYWPDIPVESVKIVLGSRIGDNGLSKWGDAVVLKDSLNNKIDAMSYGDDTSQLNPSVPSSGKGASLARTVKGYDTDSAQDWVINATANPGTNPSENGVEIMRFTSEGIEVGGSPEKLPILENDNCLEESEESEIEVLDEEQPVKESSVVAEGLSIATKEEPIITEEAAIAIEEIPTADEEVATTTEEMAIIDEETATAIEEIQEPALEAAIETEKPMTEEEQVIPVEPVQESLISDEPAKLEEDVEPMKLPDDNPSI